MTVPRSNASHDQNRVPTLMGVSMVDGTTPVPIEVDPITGQLQVSSTGVGLFTKGYDYIAVDYPTTTTEVYTTRVGGSGGVLQETVTVTYTDSTKASISSAART